MRQFDRGLFQDAGSVIAQIDGRVLSVYQFKGQRNQRQVLVTAQG